MHIYACMHIYNTCKLLLFIVAPKNVLSLAESPFNKKTIIMKKEKKKNKKFKTEKQCKANNSACCFFFRQFLFWSMNNNVLCRCETWLLSSQFLSVLTLGGHMCFTWYVTKSGIHFSCLCVFQSL